MKHHTDLAILEPILRGLYLADSASPVTLALAHDSVVANLSALNGFTLDGSARKLDGQLDEKNVARVLSDTVKKMKALPDSIRVVLDGEKYAFTVSRSLSAASRADVVNGKVALVTGGAQGLGEEIVRGLASSGAYVFVADLNVKGATELCEELNASGISGRAYPVEVNVVDENSVAAMFDTVARTAGGLDLVVSNAGVLRAGSVLDQDAENFRFVTEVNYTGFFLITKHAGLLLRRQHLTAPGWTTDIIQINSKSGLQGSNKNGAYAGSKFGSVGLVQSYALELVELGVKVNAICPGNFFDGPLWSDPRDGLFVQYLNSGKVPGAATAQDVRSFYESKVPMKRGAQGVDVMRAIYYLVEQEYETGQALPVTGGQVMLG